ncbi:MAG: transcriptional regulator, TetR family [Modestobacter sp.]|nr:transcriptional regulator, TetR family [Modestobacter sp.]
MTADRPRRGRPRDDSVDERVLEAVVAELGEAGTAGFSVNAVCARARVAKRSVAARWPDRGALILAGLNSLAAGLEPPRTGALESDLRALAAEIVAMTDEPRRSVLAHCAAELRAHPEYYQAFTRDSIDRCMAAVQDVLVDARDRGEVRADVDLSLTADCFVSAILGSRSFGSRAFETANDGPAAGPPTTAARAVSRHFIDIFTRGICDSAASAPTQRTESSPA